MQIPEVGSLFAYRAQQITSFILRKGTERFSETLCFIVFSFIFFCLIYFYYIYNNRRQKMSMKLMVLNVNFVVIIRIVLSRGAGLSIHTSTHLQV